MFQKDPLPDPKTIRLELRLTQAEFWQNLGVTQSGGSRYENGRRLPKPVAELLRVVYIEGIDLARLNTQDAQIIRFIKSHHPELFRQLKEAAMAHADEE